MTAEQPAPAHSGALNQEAVSTALRVIDPASKLARRIGFSFNGAKVDAYEGETIAAALAAAGIAELGRRRDGTSRGVWCGMGVCQECVVTVDGAPSLRACMTAVRENMEVAAQDYSAPIPESPGAADTGATTPSLERPQVLVVGAGPAGLSAARAAALCGATVSVVDERAAPGGQYFKQLAKSHGIVELARSDAQMRAGRQLIDEVETLGVAIWRNATVWGAFGGAELAATIDGAQHVFAPERLVLATGVYERGVPVPGWTLPGYMATGAAQTLLRAYRVVPGRRVLVAGNGPLNLQVAAELIKAGAEVVAVVETAARPAWRHVMEFLRAAFAAPKLIADGIGYLVRLKLANVPVIYGSAVVAAHGETRVEACTIARIDGAGQPISGTSSRFAVDAVCVGYGFLPSNEIARGLGCRHRVCGEDGRLSTVVDNHGLTSVSGVYAIGDVVALRGAHAARCQGFITGCAVARSLGFALPRQVLRELERSVRQLARHLSFQSALWRLFAAPVLRDQLAASETIVCRCENVARAAVDDALRHGAATLGAVKRRTRAGMGRCQGRYCEGVIAAMLAQAPGIAHDELFSFSPRVPIKPVRIKDLA